LHLSNVVEGRFYDWGDAVVAHPFASLLLPLTFLHERVGAEAVPRVRDAYLETWDGIAPHAELVETVELACRVAKAARALTWIRAGDDLRGPLYCLRSILDDSYLGGT
jgi:hypothetical protein